MPKARTLTKAGLEDSTHERGVIRAKGVRVHNLKNVEVDIPRGKLVAVCGLSGSGKTSLALDTLYAEGQRRYIESFSAYTRQFLERLEKPDYDSIDGLPPALAVTRGNAPRGNRSTVGTASETLDYLRLVFANASKLLCYRCGKEVHSYDPQRVANLISALPRCRVMLAFQAEYEGVADRATVLSDLQNQGFVRLVAGGRILNLGRDDREVLGDSLPDAGQVAVVVDRLKGGDNPTRTTESLEAAFEHGFDSVTLFIEAPKSVATENWPVEIGIESDVQTVEIDNRPWLEVHLSRHRQCHNCGLEYPDPEPRLFSFNSPLGACAKCEGFGDTIDLDWDLIIPNRQLSISEGAIAPWNSPAYEHNWDELMDVAEAVGIPTDVPFRKLSKKQIRFIMEGDEKIGYEGIEGFFRWLERKKYKMHVRVFISRWRSYNRCTACGGARLSPESLAYKIDNRNFAELCELRIDELIAFFDQIELTERDAKVVDGPLEQVKARLHYLELVGLGYLQLSRTLRTLSGGEAQRTALSAALGSNLVNMLYVLDEPSVGLHSHDVERLIHAIQKLVDRGNTVLVVEHEEEILKRSDWLIELGPEAGNRGGELVYSNWVADSLVGRSGHKSASTKRSIKKGKPGSRKPTQPSEHEALTIVDRGSVTLDFLNGKRMIPIPQSRRSVGNWIGLKGCSGNNLQNIDVDFPLGVLCAITGVSGSGKSSLVQDTLFGALSKKLDKPKVEALDYNSLTGAGLIEDCIFVDQSPVSRSPRSNPVTFVKAFDEVRAAFANTPESKLKGLTPGHFSFNSDLGRCQHCKGDGQLQVDMQFLADVTMTCPVCHGKRYRKEILGIHYRGKSIADVLDMTVHEAGEFFRGSLKVQQKLQVLRDVGLDYLHLGQSATTLSSGEAQRLKLAGFLANASRRRTLFILDEPTTGLHYLDVVKLLACFNALLEAGHSVIIVEHNTHLVAAADYVIDLGPGPAERGGRVVVAGTPEEVVDCPDSVTGRYLAEILP